ncbi:MAG: tRNA (adenosine(37)-N6)-threonylcarbamoyltransferase complex transferase subunit TsaD, partial [Bacteroidales bacterium]|nr:tRNA (adenosine(37)-N6)-threonylcarbamoyltransferase complex transferase subunit TsaD [Bacteroidales bacterium]
VSANSGLRNEMTRLATKKKLNLFLPDLDLTTDNAAMIALCGYCKYIKNEFSSLNAIPYSNIKLTNH